MASVALSPWPAATATVTRQAAVAALRDALGVDLSDDRVSALGETASALVERYAAAAPAAVKNEAVIRAAGWLKASPKGDLAPTGVGGIDLSWRPGAARNVLRSSGAAGLLSPWRKPRGLVIG